MWSVALVKPVLNDSELHVWRASLKIDAATEVRYIAMLEESELVRANKFRFAKDRLHFIAARGLLRSVLGRYLTCDPKEVVFGYGPYGKPALVNDETLQFNLSHAGGKALLGLVRNHALGIDLEQIRPGIEYKEIATHFFAAKEVETLLSLPADQRPLGFFNCWTRKEAFIKAKGTGLSFPLDQFEVSLRPNEPARLLATHWDDQEVRKWSLFALEPIDGFVGAIAVEGLVESLRCWEWQSQTG